MALTYEVYLEVPELLQGLPQGLEDLVLPFELPFLGSNQLEHGVKVVGHTVVEVGFEALDVRWCLIVSQRVFPVPFGVSSFEGLVAKGTVHRKTANQREEQQRSNYM